MNGLGLDDWLEPVIDLGQPDVPVVRLAEDLPGVDVRVRRGRRGHQPPPVARRALCRETTSGGSPTPWPPPIRANAATFKAGGDAYAAAARCARHRDPPQIATIPAANRKLVSFHEAFPYFAKAYGLTIVGSVVAGSRSGSVGAARSPRSSVRSSARGRRPSSPKPGSIPTCRRRSPTRPASRSKRNLYNDSLGDPPVDTYEGLIRWDVDRIVAALGGRGYGSRR